MDSTLVPPSHLAIPLVSEPQLSPQPIYQIMLQLRMAMPIPNGLSEAARVPAVSTLEALP